MLNFPTFVPSFRASAPAPKTLHEAVSSRVRVHHWSMNQTIRDLFMYTYIYIYAYISYIYISYIYISYIYVTHIVTYSFSISSHIDLTKSPVRQAALRGDAIFLKSTPRKTNMTIDKIAIWRCIFYWNMGIFQCHVSFQGTGGESFCHWGEVYWWDADRATWIHRHLEDVFHQFRHPPGDVTQFQKCRHCKKTKGHWHQQVGWETDRVCFSKRFLQLWCLLKLSEFFWVRLVSKAFRICSGLQRAEFWRFSKMGHFSRIWASAWQSRSFAMFCKKSIAGDWWLYIYIYNFSYNIIYSTYIYIYMYDMIMMWLCSSL